MKKLVSLFTSMQTMTILMSILAFACGYATFLENDFGTITAKADIYNAKWFEVLLLLLTINLVYNIYKHKMYTVKKAPIFIFHIAFIVIILGAAITRYEGFEGTMHIREGDAVSTMLSTDILFNVKATAGKEEVSTSQVVYLSKRRDNTLESNFEIDGKTVEVELLEYTPNAIDKLIQDPNGKPIAELMVTRDGKGDAVNLALGEYYETNDFFLNFNAQREFNKPVVDISIKDGKLFMKHDIVFEYLKMDGGKKGQLVASNGEELTGRTLFTNGGSSFVLRNFMPNAKVIVVTDPKVSPRTNGLDAFKFRISVDNETVETMVVGKKGTPAREYHTEINGVNVHLSYGAKVLHFPFSIRLNDFELDRYPGSMSPASYASEVTLIDKDKGVEMPYRIYMNNILSYGGYKFFQASYDMDEKGTILSVNNDPGTIPTYIGYFLLALGMFWSLFSKRNRFSKLAEKAKKASDKQLLAVLLSLGVLLSVTPAEATELSPALKTIISFDKEHSKKFGELIVQDTAGRMKPMDTLSNEILIKIHGTPSLKVGKDTLDANQVILGMMMRAEVYKDIKIIKTKNREINGLLGIKDDARYASFSQFFQDPSKLAGYKLTQSVEAATRKEAKYRNKFDKAVLKVDEKLNITYMVFAGDLMKIWPKPNDDNNKWFATMEGVKSFPKVEAEELRIVAVEYFTSIDSALATGNWGSSDRALNKISEHQKKYGAEVYPSDNRIYAEVLYNEANIFERLYPFYLLVGFILLIASFIKIIKPNFKIDTISKVTLWLLILFFIFHTIGLVLRWYISGHSPWSNGYESMIYIGWATVLAGFIFSKRSTMTMASTGILTGLILFVAHLNWMNPQITTLVPVLNSYWLSIHVSMITASYGFLGLSALLGFIVIILFIFKDSKNNVRISLSIKELNAISEMSLMIGITLLTVGNFLGGVWANESWGRYWGWDPKETWTLVTILVYAVVLHLRFIKSLYSEFNYAVISLLSFSSVIMTYFGVNYYLAGLHSYAKGDPVPIPDFVPVTYMIIFVIIALAFRNRKLA